MQVWGCISRNKNVDLIQIIIIIWLQGGVWLAPNVFFRRTMTRNIYPRSLRTIFRVNKNKKSWKCWHGPHTARISTSLSLSEIREREGFKEAEIYRRSVVGFARCLKQAEFLWKLCASVGWMRFGRKRVITRNIDLMWFDLLFIQCILLIYEKNLFTDSFLIAFLVCNIFSDLPITFAQHCRHKKHVFYNKAQQAIEWV